MRKSATVVVVMTIAATNCFAEATCQHCKKKGILLEFVMQQSLEVANIGALRLGGLELRDRPLVRHPKPEKNAPCFTWDVSKRILLW